MDVREVYQRIQELQDEIAALGPLDPEVRKRIDYKFRLDWNYHSNNIEGGTLTVAETKSIMLGHVTVDDKPLKDILEMKGHDQTVKTIMSIGKGEVQLSEKRIKEIHAAIIQEDDPELKPSVGQWKTLANEIKNKGETVRFTEPDEVPEAIHKLLDWFKAENDKIKRQHKDALPAPLLAFEFHLRFLTIHPFYDGNGRVGRILLNLILISMGYPPLIVTADDKPKYNDLLTEIQLYGGSRNDLWAFLGKLLIRSMEMVKKAIDGEEILEVKDAEKRLAWLKNNLNTEARGQNPRLTREVVEDTFHNWLEFLLRDIGMKSMEFKEFFESIEFKITHTTPNPGIYIKNRPQSISRAVSDPRELTLSFFKEYLSSIPRIVGFASFNFDTICHGYNLSGQQTNIDFLRVQVNFKSDSYQVQVFRSDQALFHENEPHSISGALGVIPSTEDLKSIKDYAFHLQVTALEDGAKRLGLLD